jgi:hypothetical protein
MQNKKEERAQKFKMITQWQQSGLSQTAFCAANKIAYHVFHYYYGVYRSNKTSSDSFLPVKVTSAVSREQITITGISGIRIQLPNTEQSIDIIKQLLLS